MKSLSVAEANEQFSEVLRQVRQGESFLVTSHGEPVAKIVPIKRSVAGSEQALARLLEHLDAQPTLNMPITWTRSDLYED